MFTPFNDARLAPANAVDPISPRSSTSKSVPRPPVTSTPSPQTEVQTLVLNRLRRLVRVEAEWRHRVADGDWRIKLIHKAIYSTYCDCITEGIVDQARLIVRNCRGELLS